MKIITKLFLFVIISCILSGNFSCSTGEKTADKISKTMVDQPMDKAKRTKVIADLTTISRAIQIFNTEKGRNPNDLQELTDQGYLQSYPVEPFGGKYLYDSGNGSVRSSTHPDFKPGQDQ